MEDEIKTWDELLASNAGSVDNAHFDALAQHKRATLKLMKDPTPENVKNALKAANVAQIAVLTYCEGM